MRRFIAIFLLILLSIIIVSCKDQNVDENSDQIYQIYLLASEATGYDGTYEEWLEIVRGPQGLPGKNIDLQVSNGFIQWRYTGDIEWNNLIDLLTLTGAQGDKGDDGREVIFQVNNGLLQWQYNDDNTWNNLFDLTTLNGSDGSDGINGQDGDKIVLRINEGILQWKYSNDSIWNNLGVYNNIFDDYYLSDVEVNHILTNYAQDIKSFFPSVNLSTLDIVKYTNNCDTVDYELCNNKDNYPMIFGEGFKNFVDKQNATYLLADAMSTISNLMGSFDSQPIVPNKFLSNNNTLANVAGRNDTSVLFEGNLDGSIPIDIPLDVKFTYQLLIYKSIEDNKTYVEGNIMFESGFLFLDFELANSTFLITYNTDLSVESFIYTTDVVGLNEWVTVMKPHSQGIEIYSTNSKDVEYFRTDNDKLYTLLSTNDWSNESIEYLYEYYQSNHLEYIMSSLDTGLNYIIPLSSIDGWNKVEYTEDSKWGDNDFLIKISSTTNVLIEETITETELLGEPVWIKPYDFTYYYNNSGVLSSSHLTNTLVISSKSKQELIEFLVPELTYQSISTWDEHTLVLASILNYSYFGYTHGALNVDDIYAKFNLKN